MNAPSVSSDTSYSCILTAADGKGAQSSDSVVVRVKNRFQSLFVSKKVRNITRGSGWSADSLQASPGDRLEFLIEITAGSTEINNIIIRDEIPSQIISCHNRRIDNGPACNTCTCDDLEEGIALRWLEPGETRTLIYEGQLCSQSGQYACGTVTLSNTAIFSADGLNATDSVQIVVNNPCYSRSVCTYFPSTCCYWPPCDYCDDDCCDEDCNPVPPPPPPTPDSGTDICPPGERGPDPP